MRKRPLQSTVPAEKSPIPAPTPEGWHTVLGVPNREEYRYDALSKWAQAEHQLPVDDLGENMPPAFYAGFDAGESFGYTFGFNNGANEAVRGLTGIPNRGMRQREQFTRRGNQYGVASTTIQEISADQLTAELVQILSAYAVLPSRDRVAACLDAMKSIPGIEWTRLATEQDEYEEGR